jgi:hypothetical protein
MIFVPVGGHQRAVHPLINMPSTGADPAVAHIEAEAAQPKPAKTRSKVVQIEVRDGGQIVAHEAV